ncbi:hypothetical protein QBC40DRAFT_205317 [Triangularia verruculosa]|uniref:Formylmethionine deformylase-like protein n=1 Tax=Triangularia verruculosa TaxID=2587418 RepID=A0AAN6XI58_9PEZI|nr:hypothetical protein QBC40DRAFT_205317 [Triangularia verruculosa]
MAPSTPFPAKHQDSYRGSKRSPSHILTSEIDPRLHQGPLSEKRFSIQAPLIVCLLVAAAFGFAIGHHFWYRSLDSTVVQSSDEQSWSIRLGTACAVLTKASLVGLIGIAAVQQIWLMLRMKAMTLGGIDGMFAIMHEPTAIFNRELLAHGKVLILFAAVSWVIPLLTIVTPATLSIRSVMSSSTNLAPVRTVNFTNSEEWATAEGAGMIRGPGTAISRLFTEVYASRRIIPQDPPSPNATYELDFWGPSYKCEDINDFIKTRNKPTWNISDSYPGSPYKTFRDAFFGELPDASKKSSKPSGILYQAAAPSYMNNVLLLHAGWDSGSSIVCQLYNTSYTLSISFINGDRSIIPLAIRYLEPAAWDHSAGRFSGLSGPDTVLPTFYVTHLLFSSLMVNIIRIGVSCSLSFDGEAKTIPLLQSSLPFCPEVARGASVCAYFQNPSACRNQSLSRAIEDLSRNFTISTMGYEFWEGSAMTTVPMTITFPQNQYSYQQSTLLITYGGGFAVAFLCLALGAFAVKRNGLISSTAFSTIMLTTRNPDLDDLAAGRWLGSTPLSNDIAKVRLRFGHVRDRDGDVHAGFGLDGTLVPIGGARSAN